MKDAPILDYATRKSTKPRFGRGISLFIVICSIIIIAYGIWYLQCWYTYRTVGAGADDLPRGLGTATVGIVLLITGIRMYTRGRKPPPPSQA